jgi:hypothetical protein
LSEVLQAGGFSAWNTSYDLSKENSMKTPYYKKPVPAVAIAVGVAVVAHKANENAARALGVPLLAISAIIALILGGLALLGM